MSLKLLYLNFINKKYLIDYFRKGNQNKTNKRPKNRYIILFVKLKNFYSQNKFF